MEEIAETFYLVDGTFNSPCKRQLNGTEIRAAHRDGHKPQQWRSHK